jgi:predicted amidophosphoribosyltransferase
MRLQETTIFFQRNRYRHYYLCQYLPLCSGIDTESRSLLKFKRGVQPDLESWIDRALGGFCETPVLLPADTIIIRALRHQETRIVTEPPSSLDRLGRALSERLSFSYLPHLLYKTRLTVVNQGLGRGQREAEMRDVYKVDGDGIPGVPSSFLLLDDILTTGATVLSILGTVTGAFPGCKVTVFTLAKTH